MLRALVARRLNLLLLAAPALLAADPKVDPKAKPEAEAKVEAKADVRDEILVVVNKHIITRRTLNQSVEQQHAALYRQFAGKELDAKLADAFQRNTISQASGY